MNKQKKTLYTLAVDNYAPEITEITFPYLKRYAEKIEADFYVITDRKFPDAPPVYEKFQVYELSKEHKNDWNIFVDADALIHPEFFDVTSTVGKDMTVSHGTDFVPHRFRPNEYSMRDGRFIGKGNWLAIFSDWCRDYYQPLDISIEEAIKDIFPTVDEQNNSVTACHLIDDYTVSRNIARYGLKHMIIPDMDAPGIKKGLFAHQYLMPIEKKVIYLQSVLKRMESYMSYKSSENKIQGWMSDDELLWLYEQALKMNSIVEIGSWKGRSSHALLSGCHGMVYCVDTFKGSIAEQEHNHKEASEGTIFNQHRDNLQLFDNLITIVGDNKDIVNIFQDNSIDMVFIDGSHIEKDVIADILRWQPRCKKLLCGHDWHQIGGDRIADLVDLPLKWVGWGSLWTLEIER